LLVGETGDAHADGKVAYGVDDWVECDVGGEIGGWKDAEGVLFRDRGDGPVDFERMAESEWSSFLTTGTLHDGFGVKGVFKFAEVAMSCCGEVAREEVAKGK